MSLPNGVFIIVVKCADCGQELKRSDPIRERDYTLALIFGPLNAPRCPNGCRASFGDCNLNTRHEWQREDGTIIERDL